MRKLITPLIIIICLFTCSIYIFIPNTISIQKTKLIAAKKEGLIRVLMQDCDWNKFIEEIKSKNQDKLNQFLFKDKIFNISYHTPTSLRININDKEENTNSILGLFAKEPDSTIMIWSTNIPTSINPFKRLQIYSYSKLLSNDMDLILNKWNNHFSKMESIYGIEVKREEILDSILISTSSIKTELPTTKFIYQQIDILQKYSKKQNAIVSGYPMLNITNLGSSKYLIRIALPVNKELSSTKNIEYKRMMGRGKILAVTVVGGDSSIENAFSKFKNYIADYRFQSPAISFLSLITDRSIIKDSSKWVTRIYYPVM